MPCKSLTIPSLMILRVSEKVVLTTIKDNKENTVNATMVDFVILNIAFPPHKKRVYTKSLLREI
jgi:hypothetical protein